LLGGRDDRRGNSDGADNAAELSLDSSQGHSGFPRSVAFVSRTQAVLPDPWAPTRQAAPNPSA
jgi:hypothetical protein